MPSNVTPGRRFDVGFAAVTGAVTGATAASRRLVSLTRPLAEAVVLSPPLVPEPLQPRRAVEWLAERGSRQREQLTRELAATLDRTVPIVVDEVLRRVDLDAVIARLDLARLSEEIIASVDLPEIIRESTSAVSNEAVREVRMRGISGDEAVGRAMERLLPRRRGIPAHDGR
ncbi:MAG TPA: hypothetical protein VFY58_08770 [Nocardioides sp.]|nr:hypothetical protein [Nocardioides sp.]